MPQVWRCHPAAAAAAPCAVLVPHRRLLSTCGALMLPFLFHHPAAHCRSCRAAPPRARRLWALPTAPCLCGMWPRRRGPPACANPSTTTRPWPAFGAPWACPWCHATRPAACTSGAAAAAPRPPHPPAASGDVAAADLAAASLCTLQLHPSVPPFSNHHSFCTPISFHLRCVALGCFPTTQLYWPGMASLLVAVLALPICASPLCCHLTAHPPPQLVTSLPVAPLIKDSMPSKPAAVHGKLKPLPRRDRTSRERWPHFFPKPLNSSGSFSCLAAAFADAFLLGEVPLQRQGWEVALRVRHHSRPGRKKGPTPAGQQAGGGAGAGLVQF